MNPRIQELRSTMDGLWSAPPVPPRPSPATIKEAHERRVLPFVRALTGLSTEGAVGVGDVFATTHPGDPTVTVHTLAKDVLLSTVLSKRSVAREGRLDVASDGDRLWVSVPSSSRWTRLSLNPRRNVYVEDVVSDDPASFVRAVVAKVTMEAALDALAKSFADRMGSMGLDGSTDLGPITVAVGEEARVFRPERAKPRLPDASEIRDLADALRAGDVPYQPGGRGGYDLDAPPGAPIRFSRDGKDIEGVCYLALNAALYGSEIVPLSHLYGRVKGDGQRAPVVRMYVDGQEVDEIKREPPNTSRADPDADLLPFSSGDVRVPSVERA